MSFGVVTLFPIHNIVVVTSPMGDQAPPALAAMIINPANHILVSRFLMTLCRIVINTIVAVRLSIIADKTKANIEKIKSNPYFDIVLINSSLTHCSCLETSHMVGCQQ